MSGSGMAMNPSLQPVAYNNGGNRFLEEGEAVPSHSGLVEETDFESGDVSSSPRHHFAALACAPSSSGSYMLASSFQVI